MFSLLFIMLGWDAMFNCLFNCYYISPIVTVAHYMHFLLHSQSDICHGNIALIIVDLNDTVAIFIGSENVLFKFAFNFRYSLIDAAPSSDFLITLLLNVSLKARWVFSNNEDLLVFHLILVASSFELDSSDVLDLSLGLSMNVLVVEENR